MILVSIPARTLSFTHLGLEFRVQTQGRELEHVLRLIILHDPGTLYKMVTSKYSKVVQDS